VTMAIDNQRADLVFAQLAEQVGMKARFVDGVLYLGDIIDKTGKVQDVLDIERRLLLGLAVYGRQEQRQSNGEHTGAWGTLSHGRFSGRQAGGR
jgi:hypothetical protein